VAIAIVAQTESGITPEPVSPCGNCRQVIAEEELKSGKKIRIILAGGNRSVVIESIAALLPMQFNSKDLRSVLP
jgi:cytidine deaminase